MLLNSCSVSFKKPIKHCLSIFKLVAYQLMYNFCLYEGRTPAFDHILDDIFGQLDYACLKQAELVSPIWSEAVSKRKVWKQIFVQNVSFYPKLFMTIVIVFSPVINYMLCFYTD